jgi:hypothetical protein
MKRGFAIPAILTVILVGLLGIGLFLIPFIGLSALVGKKLNQGVVNGESQFNKGGCYVTDRGFVDLAIIQTGADAYEKLKGNPQVGRRGAQAYYTEKFQYIIDQSKEAKINPVILFGIWNGEQSFKGYQDRQVEDKAMGYNVSGHGDNTVENLSPGFDKQVTGALGAIRHALDGTFVYTQPEGENVFTRLFYNYVGAAKERYNAGQPLFDEGNGRLKVYKDLIPQYYECGQGPEIFAGSNSVLTTALKYVLVNKAAAQAGFIAIRYSQGAGRCGFRKPLTVLDCSGFVSLVYREANLFPQNFCGDTLGLANLALKPNPPVKRVASNMQEAKDNLRPGDFVLSGIRDGGSGPTKITNNKGQSIAHVVIFVKWKDPATKNKMVVYHSTGGRNGPGRNGPQESDRSASHNFYGAYRSTKVTP